MISMHKIFTILLLAFFSPAFAQQAQVYTIGVENIDYYPFYSVNKKGEYIGFARDLFDAFAKAEKIEFIYKVRSVRKLDQQFVAERRFDFKFPDNKSWKPESKKGLEIYYSSPVCDFIDGVIVREENKDKGIGFFKKNGIGMVRGYSIVGYEKTGIPISENTNAETLFKNLKYDRIQGAYFNVAVGLDKVKQFGDRKSKFIFNQKIPYYKGSFYLSTLNQPDVIDQFNRFLKEHRIEVNKIKLKYGIKD